MVDIVIRDLTKSEVHDLRMLKAQMDEPTWRALFLRVTSFFKKSLTKNEMEDDDDNQSESSA